MINLAAFYAAIAEKGLGRNLGIESIEAGGRTIYGHPKDPVSSSPDAAGRASFYQLKTMLQGVVARGTARAIASLSPYVAGKTGTTEDAMDGWFVGFTNDVTVAVWVGYDNADRKRRSLGSSETGASVALPIFEPIVEAVWARKIAPKAPLSGPSPRPASTRRLTDRLQGRAIASADKLFIEYFRLGRRRPSQRESVPALCRATEAYAAREQYPGSGQWTVGVIKVSYWGRAVEWPELGRRTGRSSRSAPWSGAGSTPSRSRRRLSPGPVACSGNSAMRKTGREVRQRAPRRDPDYFWGGRFKLSRSRLGLGRMMYVVLLFGLDGVCVRRKRTNQRTGIPH